MSDKVDYAPIIADLERKRAEIDQTIASLKRLSGLSENGSDASSSTTDAPLPTGIGGGLRDDAFFGMKGPEAVKAFLAWAKRPQGAAKIASELVAHGFTTTATTPANAIRTTLVRLQEAGEVVQVKKEWGLASWYPGFKRRPKPDEDGDDSDDSATDAAAQQQQP